MILYFSGTGNSRYAANLMGKALNDDVVSITGLISDTEEKILESSKPFVFVVPTYCYHLPSVVEDFIVKTEFSGCDKVYFIMTCGAGTGGAGAANKALCEAKKLSYMGTYTLVMPDNYLVMYDPSDRDESEALLAALPEKVEEMADVILSGNTFDVNSSVIGKQISVLSSKLFNTVFVKPQKFTVTDACVSCGVCARNCPLHNIDIVDGAPKWGENCVHCLACICSCPKNAIEYGKGTKGRRRHYVFPDGTLK